MGLKDKFGVDLGVFKDSTTWKALAIGIVLFSIIGYAGLSMFDLASEGYGVDRDDIRLAPDFEVETVNRTKSFKIVPATNRNDYDFVIAIITHVCV